MQCGQGFRAEVGIKVTGRWGFQQFGEFQPLFQGEILTITPHANKALPCEYLSSALVDCGKATSVFVGAKTSA